MSLTVLVLAGQLIIGGATLTPADFVDGRSIADANGNPVVMMTLTPAAVAQIGGTDATLDGQPRAVRRTGATIEIDGAAGFDAANALALRLSGKAPLPDSLDE